jgi:SAM-dependent methyltransferase
MDLNKKASFFYERKQIADQLKKARTTERSANEESYLIHRSGKECLFRLGGLRYFFNYIRTLNTNKVLDIGVGTGNASSVISKMDISAGLDFEVTALRNLQDLAKNFSKDKIHITEVESLRGIPNESVAGVIGVNSIAYATYPKFAVKRINEVLISGGAVKATFHSIGGGSNHDGAIFKGPEKFAEAFKSLGYDVVYVDNRFIVDTNDGPEPLVGASNSIVVAIKPGNAHAPQARELLSLDLGEVKSHSTKEANGYPVYSIED